MVNHDQVYKSSNTCQKVLLIKLLSYTNCQTFMHLYLMVSFIIIYRVLTQPHEAVIRFSTSLHNCLKTWTFSNYVDLSDYYVDLSENNVDLSENNVDLSDNDVDLSDKDVDLSGNKLTSRWQLVALTGYEDQIFSY